MIRLTDFNHDQQLLFSFEVYHAGVYPVHYFALKFMCTGEKFSHLNKNRLTREVKQHTEVEDMYEAVDIIS